MRRAIVRKRESARHPFRIGLPAIGHDLLRNPPFSTQDVRDFLLAYCACFLAISAFLG
jgi:hypothetical protein